MHISDTCAKQQFPILKTLEGVIRTIREAYMQYFAKNKFNSFYYFFFNH